MNTAICIPTYKRPQMLRKLIASLISSHKTGLQDSDISIVIVDNDIMKSAEETVADFQKQVDGTLKIEYHSYPVKGLSNVRNELLDKALSLNPDFLVFVDDDEFVPNDWLNQLLKTIVINQGDMATGPTIPIFEKNIPNYISCWFYRPEYEDNYLMNMIKTGNLIINSQTLLKHKIRFDNRFNTTGAEDSYFGKQLLELGAKCFWSAKAVIYETIPSDRANIKWLIKRYFNGANTYTYILKLDKHYKDLARKTVTSFIYILVGALTSPAVIFPFRRKYWGVLKFSEGIGALAALFSIKYYEYK